MKMIQALMLKLRRDEKGATVIEYALIAALVAVVAIAGFSALGKGISTKMSNIATSVGT
jgi:pilus assembly protein Flp/PilA